MLFTDLQEIKTLLEIDPLDNSENSKLWIYIRYATDWIEEIIGRPGISFASRTEFYDGTGTPKLILRSRPVYLNPEIEVYIDSGGYFGQVSGSFNPTTSRLYWGRDFVLRTDGENNAYSRSGILQRVRSAWTKPSVRQPGYLSPFINQDTGSIKVIYSGGYTVDTLPSNFRLACNLLVSEFRYIFPLGMQLGSESYEGRSIAPIISEKQKLLRLVIPLIAPYISWKWQ